MLRGTTPTLEIKITGINVTELESIYITLKQYQKQVTKQTEDITADEITNTLYVPLSQEDTLTLSRGICLCADACGDKRWLGGGK